MGANCYANSLLQMISANPVLCDTLIRAKITNDAGEDVSDVIAKYKEAQENGTNPPSLAPLEALVKIDGRYQQDPCDLFQRLAARAHTNRVLNPNLHLTNTYAALKTDPIPPAFEKDPHDQNKYSQTGFEGCSGIILHVEDDRRTSLEELIQQACAPIQQRSTDKVDIENGKLRLVSSQIKGYSAPPDTLIFNIQTFPGSQAVVDVPERFMMPNGLLNSQTPPDEEYQLRSFAVHTGGSSDGHVRQDESTSGHYVSYVKIKGQNGTTDYYECDDGKITKLKNREGVSARDQFMEKAKKARIANYNKVAQEDRRLNAVAPANINKPVDFNDLTPEQQRVEIFNETRRVSQNQLRELTEELVINGLSPAAKNPVAPKNPGAQPPPVYVLNATTQEVTQKLVQNGWIPSALVMADAKKPGGGVANGRTAQEEIINRQSNAAEGIEKAKQQGLYQGGLQNGYAMHNVTYFRGDEKDGYASLEQPFQASLFFSAAIDLRNEKSMPADYVRRTEESIRHILRQAILDGNDSLVLGAYGCGVFKGKFNDVPETVAKCFRSVLDHPEFRGHFNLVVFAITDDENGKGNLAAFTTGLNPTNGTLQTLPANPTPPNRKDISKVDLPVRKLKKPTPHELPSSQSRKTDSSKSLKARNATKNGKSRSAFANRFRSSPSNTLDNYESLRRKKVTRKT